MIQAIKVNRGGLIEAHFLGGRPAAVEVSLYEGQGGDAVVDAQAATLDTVDTDLAAGAAAGARSLMLTSVAGVVAGRRYLVGEFDSGETPEAVTVRSVSGSVATLWAPLMQGHATGAAFSGTRVTYLVDDAAAADQWWDGYADWVPSSGEVATEVVDCALRPFPLRLIDETDIRRVWADAAAVLPSTLDMPHALLEARDELLRRLGGKVRAHSMLGADHFRRVCAQIFWLLRRYELGEAYAERMDTLGEEVSATLEDIQHQVSADMKQSGDMTEAQQGGYTSRNGEQP